MRNYGDHARKIQSRDLVDELRAICGQSRTSDQAEALFFGAGELAQGILDANFEVRRREDDWGACEDACSSLLRECAELYLSRSIPAGFRERLSRIAPLLDDLESIGLPRELRINVPEGYAFYALSPDTYAPRARALTSDLSGSRAPIQVLGVRNTGVSLGAIVAASCESMQPIVTLRPTGNPYERVVRIGSGLRSLLLNRERHGQAPHFAVVDEGPGLSGSSMASVALWLRRHGVSWQRIHFFPSHTGPPGPHASPLIRETWQKVCVRPAATSASPPPFLGRADREFLDFSGGLWRKHLFRNPSLWPPSTLRLEKNKFLAPGPTSVLAKFEGFGHLGDFRHSCAQSLAEAFLAPRPLARKEGYGFYEWHEGARTALESKGLPGTSPRGRSALIDALGSYLCFRAKRLKLPSSVGPGMAPEDLLQMAEEHLRELIARYPSLGLSLTAISRYARHLPELRERHRPCLTDNRMHAWEWISPDGRSWLKTDAVDHFLAHDPIGAQDIHWDLAAAEVELSLAPPELGQIKGTISAARRGPELSGLQHGFYRLCYLAFHAGQCDFFARELSTTDPSESARLNARARFYAGALASAQIVSQT